MSNSIGGNMLLIKSIWNEGETFRMLPLTSDCPYLEGIFDPKLKVLVLISKTTKTALHMLPKLDDNGDPAPLKTKRPNGRMVKEERKSIETFQEFYIDNREAMEEIIKIFATNADSFDYKMFLDAELSK
jgi:hypothetical protein